MPLLPLQLVGVNNDRPPWTVPPDKWTDLSGAVFRDGIASRQLGEAPIYGTPSGAPYHLLNSDFDGVNYWLYGSNGAIYVARAADNGHTDITPAAWASPASDSPDQWTSTILNGVPCMNFSGEAPVWWDRNTGNVMQPFPDWDVNARCNALRAYRDFLLAIGYSDATNSFPDQLVWSDAADPGTVPQEWQASASNLAGSLEFGDTPGSLVDGLPLRGNFCIYKNGSTYLLQFIGGRFVFARRLLFNTSGVLSRNCIAEVEGNHIVLTDSDVIIHDGQTAKSLIDSSQRRKLFANIDQANYRNSFVFNHKSRDEVWICYPENGQTYPRTALVWDKDSNSIGFRSLDGEDNTGVKEGWPHIGYGNLSSAGVVRLWDNQAYTWDGGSADYVWNSGLSEEAIFGGVAGVRAPALLALDSGSTTPYGTIQAAFSRHSVDFGDSMRVKLCRAVYPRIEGQAGSTVNIRVGSQFYPNDPIQWGTNQPFIVGSQRKTDHAVQGRYLSFEFTSTNGEPYRVPGFDVELAQTGGMY